MKKKITVSAPGTFLVAGEHAVLYEGNALVASISQRLYVNLTPRLDNKLLIESEEFGVYKTGINNFLVEGPYRFILACCKNYMSFLKKGLTLEIQSDFSSSVGFGSSAAVTVATLRALYIWLKLHKTNIELYYEALGVIRIIQGVGSGADIAATIYGGIIYYQQKPLVIEPLQFFCDFSLIYVGYKMPTVEVIKKVVMQMKKEPYVYTRWFQEIKVITSQAKNALMQQNWQMFANLLKRQQTIFAAMSLTNNEIETIIQQCNQYDTVLAAKISGSGLGDCILCIGQLPKKSFPATKEQQEQGVTQFNVTLSMNGVLTHDIRESQIIYG